MAHSYVQAHDDEAAAFECFVRAQPQDAVLLIDTYDTERAARKVVALARKLAPEGLSIKGVRIDSGDLGEHARRVRAILDAAGLREITILASGNLDEHRVLELVAQGAPIDGFGVGTRMNTSSDAPFLDCAYKLQEYQGRARRKRSEGKATWPGRKQVFRRVGADGRFAGDIVTLSDQTVDGVPLLAPVLRAGRHVSSGPKLEVIRKHAAGQIAMLPQTLHSLEHSAPYAVEIATWLVALPLRSTRPRMKG
jgi:nicotinate phosphoribosyltransferase